MRPKPRIPQALRFMARELDALPGLDDVSRTKAVGPAAILLRHIADIFDTYGPRRFQEIQESCELLKRITPSLPASLAARAAGCLDEARSVDLSMPINCLEDIADALDQLLIDVQEHSASGGWVETVTPQIDALMVERALRWLPPMAQPGSISQAKAKQEERP